MEAGASASQPKKNNDDDEKSKTPSDSSTESSLSSQSESDSDSSSSGTSAKQLKRFLSKQKILTKKRKQAKARKRRAKERKRQERAQGPKVQVARMYQQFLTGTSSVVTTATDFGTVKVETEILHINMDQKTSWDFDSWSKYTATGDPNKDNVDFLRVPANIMRFVNGMPDGYVPTLANVVCKKKKIKKDPLRAELIASDEAHHVFTHSGAADHPIVHSVTAYINTRVNYIETAHDRQNLIVIEDPDYDHWRYSGRGRGCRGR